MDELVGALLGHHGVHHGVKRDVLGPQLDHRGREVLAVRDVAPEVGGGPQLTVGADKRLPCEMRSFVFIDCNLSVLSTVCLFVWLPFCPGTPLSLNTKIMFYKKSTKSFPQGLESNEKKLEKTWKMQEECRNFKDANYEPLSIMQEPNLKITSETPFAARSSF